MEKKDKMPSSIIIKKVPMSRRTYILFIYIDNSGSMDGAAMGAANSAISGLIPELISMNKENPNVHIKIVIVNIGENPRWITGDSGPVDPAEFNFVDLVAEGGTPMGETFSMVEDKLSVENGFMMEANGALAPGHILFSDGEPTDDYKTGLNKLWNNNWFKYGTRVAIGYGQANDAVLEEFTGNKDTVIHTNDPREIKKYIEFVTLTSTQVGTKGKIAINGTSNNMDNDDKTSEVAAAIKNAQFKLTGEVDPEDEF